MQDVLPDAQKLVSQPPFPSLPQAMVQLLAAKILTITVHEAQDFLSGNTLRPTAPGLPAPAASRGPAAPQVRAARPACARAQTSQGPGRGSRCGHRS